MRGSSHVHGRAIRSRAMIGDERTFAERRSAYALLTVLGACIVFWAGLAGLIAGWA